MIGRSRHVLSLTITTQSSFHPWVDGYLQDPSIAIGINIFLSHAWLHSSFVVWLLLMLMLVKLQLQFSFSSQCRDKCMGLCTFPCIPHIHALHSHTSKWFREIHHHLKFHQLFFGSSKIGIILFYRDWTYISWIQLSHTYIRQYMSSRHISRCWLLNYLAREYQ